MVQSTVLWAGSADGAESGRRLFTQRRQQGDAVVVEVDLAALRQARSGRPFIARRFPIQSGRFVDLKLEPFQVTTEKTRFVLGRRDRDDLTLDFDPTRIILLRGSVVDEPQSDVFIAIGQRITTGHIHFGAGGERFQIASRLQGGPTLPQGHLAVYQPVPGVGAVPGVPACGTDTQRAQRSLTPPSPQPAGAFQRRMRLLEVAIDSDYEFFELFGDLETANEYVIALYAQVSHIYMRDVNTGVTVSFVRLWDQPEDLFNEPDPFTPFRVHWNVFMGGVRRDVAQLLTGRRNLPYGGVAFLSALCSSSNAYSVIGYMLGSFPDPDRPSGGHWDIVVAAHELGHNCGAVHTHDVEIDYCAFGQQVRGTVMSYCHTQPGGTSNIDLRLHRILQKDMDFYISLSDCIGMDCNLNAVEDEDDLFNGTSLDVNGNLIPDECEDCNANGILDELDINDGSQDLNNNAVPDECEPDCNNNARPDDFDVDRQFSDDENGNYVPDECEPDCDGNGLGDYFEIMADMSLDIDRDAMLDACQDCDNDGINDFDALDGAHSVWLAASNRIAQFHPSSGVIMRLSPFVSAIDGQDLIISDTGRIFVSRGSADRVEEFSRYGEDLGMFVFAGDGGLDYPTGLTFTPQGNLLVCSSETDSVIEYDGQTGAFIRTFVTSGAGVLDSPHGLTFGPGGNLYVSNYVTNRITVYEGVTGAFVGDFLASGTTPPDGPIGMVFKPDGNLLVANNNAASIYEYDGVTGEFLGRFDRSGNPGGFWEISNPHTIRIGPDGDIYVSASSGGVMIHMYDIDNGLFMRTYYVLPQQGVSAPQGFDFMPGGDVDCNVNIIPDVCDIASGRSRDVNHNNRPDECEAVGDADGDLDVDLFDVDRFVACVTGPGGNVAAECTLSDLDADDDVDLIDFGLLMERFTGDCAVEITQHPADVTLCAGESASFHALATGLNVTYQWYHDGETVAGADQPDLFVDSANPGTVGSYSVIASTHCLSRQSSAAELSVHPLPFITDQPDSLTVCPGSPASLSVAAGGVAPITLQWQLDGVDIPGAIESIYQILGVRENDFGEYRCSISDGCGSVSLSDAGQLHTAGARIDEHPVGATICAGGSHFMLVDAFGSSFQWYKDGAPVGDATLSFHVISNATPEDAGTYHVVVSNDCNSVQSHPAVVEVQDCPDTP